MNDETPPARRRLEKIHSVERRVGFKKSWIYEQLASGDSNFPAPLKIGSATRWDSRAIDAWIEEQVRLAADGAAPAAKEPTDGFERGRTSRSRRGV